MSHLSNCSTKGLSGRPRLWLLLALTLVAIPLFMTKPFRKPSLQRSPVQRLSSLESTSELQARGCSTKDSPGRPIRDGHDSSLSFGRTPKMELSCSTISTRPSWRTSAPRTSSIRLDHHQLWFRPASRPTVLARSSNSRCNRLYRNWNVTLLSGLRTRTERGIGENALD